MPRCQCKTAKGKLCSRSAVYDGFCWQHKECKNTINKEKFYKFYTKNHKDVDITSVKKLTKEEYLLFLKLTKRFPNQTIVIEGIQNVHDFYPKNMEIKEITEPQYDILDNTDGVDLYEDVKNRLDLFCKHHYKIHVEGRDIVFGDDKKRFQNYVNNGITTVKSLTEKEYDNYIFYSKNKKGGIINVLKYPYKFNFESKNVKITKIESIEYYKLKKNISKDPLINLYDEIVRVKK